MFTHNQKPLNSVYQPTSTYNVPHHRRPPRPATTTKHPVPYRTLDSTALPVTSSHTIASSAVRILWYTQDPVTFDPVTITKTTIITAIPSALPTCSAPVIVNGNFFSAISKFGADWTLTPISAGTITAAESYDCTSSLCTSIGSPPRRVFLLYVTMDSRFSNDPKVIKYKMKQKGSGGTEVKRVTWVQGEQGTWRKVDEVFSPKVVDELLEIRFECSAMGPGAPQTGAMAHMFLADVKVKPIVIIA
ncbi:hypothetical protein BJ508DRAFT_310366 [Ascobolus immersus RN42]|uniref:Uncharacterized protein n=1 Tax=Ascobolus immersus RN42 TaxID=1160509 RepID=A0A3N4HZB8_ASCIM|nr:hypothetical protein BJ508DRAFT_310366 [Ascobolus immersus RN42]